MARQKAKGSLVYEILIVLLVVALIATLLYPKSVWNRIDHRTILCRDQMKRIVDAENLYISYHESNNYDTSLVDVINFIENDSLWMGDSVGLAQRDSFYIKVLTDYFRDYRDYATKRAKDSSFTLIENKKDSVTAVRVNSLVDFMLSNLYTCPTVQDTYKTTVIDTSAVKIFKVKCPITEAQADSMNSRFWFHFLGGGEIENHGMIDNGEPTWRKEKRK